MQQLNPQQQAKAIDFLTYALADLQGLVEYPENLDTREAAQETINDIEGLLRSLNLID